MPSPNATVANNKCRLHKAARHELSLLSPVKLSEIFSDEAWSYQPDICVPKLEAMTQARHAWVEIHPQVAAVYGNLTPSLA